jgi:chemotaxis protein methyltransferase CheR
VGETYFFRDKQSFDAIEQHVLPALLRARETGERRLRIWSAGCCTGEEPYSIAMLLDRLLPSAETWHITLLATDINPAFLRKAAEGEYGEWSFRSTPDWIRDRYFHPRRGGRFKLDDQIRKRVTFSYLNLADDAYPSLTSNTNAMDIIFCRNVLMYFDAKHARTVVENLRRALVDGGWLIVSPAETSSALFSSFTTVEFEGAILYRNDGAMKAPHFVSHVPARAPGFVEQPRPLAEPIIPQVEVLPESIQISTLSTPAGEPAPIPPDQTQLSSAARECRDFMATPWIIGVMSRKTPNAGPFRPAPRPACCKH